MPDGFAQEQEDHHAQQVRGRNNGECRAKAEMRHDRAGDYGPERNRNEADEVIQAKSRVEEILRHQIAQQRLRESLSGGDRRAIEDEIDQKRSRNTLLPTEPERGNSRDEQRSLNDARSPEAV